MSRPTGAGAQRPSTRGNGTRFVPPPPTRELGAAGASRSFLASPTVFRTTQNRTGVTPPETNSRAMGRARAFLEKIQDKDERMIPSPETVRKEPRKMSGVRDSSALSPVMNAAGQRSASPSTKSIWMQHSAKQILGNTSPTPTSGRPHSRCRTPVSPQAKHPRTNFQETNDRLAGLLEEAHHVKENALPHAHHPPGLRKSPPRGFDSQGRNKKDLFLAKKSTDEMRSELLQIFEDAKVYIAHSRTACITATA